MSRRIKKVAVLGSGVMGSGIACHFANIGLQVLMLDIAPRDLKEEEKDHPAARNQIVNKALAAAIKSKPAALYDKSFAARITTGNFTDDFAATFIFFEISPHFYFKVFPTFTFSILA